MSNNRTLSNLAQLLDSAASGSAISKRNGSIGTIAMTDSDVGGVASTGFYDSNLIKNVIDINHITKVGGTTSSSDGLKAILQGNAPTTLNPSASATYNLGDSSNPIDEIILDSSATIFFGDISLTSILKSGTSTIAVAAVVASPVSGSAETSFLLQTDSTQTDAQVDASTNTFTITESGDVKSTAFTPYHPKGYSSYFDGSGDYLTVADDASLDLSTGDFTIEAWVWVDSTNVNNAGIIGKRGTTTFGTGNWRISFLTATNKIAMAHNNEDVNINTPEVTLNAWNHIAFCRSGTTLYCLANGALGDTDASYGHSFDNTESLYIGLNASLAFKGYIADVRILKGTALYTGSYDIPTERLTSITNTSLLTCHLPYIADGSSNDHSITITGNTKTQQFGPYDHVAYSPSSHGGSVYFDGTGDYITVPSNSGAPFDFGTDNFTIEGWFYLTTSGSWTSYWGISEGGGSSQKINLYDASGDGTLDVDVNGSVVFSSSAVLTDLQNKWAHIALVREGTGTNQTKLYVNGSVVGQGTVSTNFSGFSQPFTVGHNGEIYSGGFYGYISDFRVVNGTAVYTANFTPPTEPLTAIAGTQLLTCTNKNSIYDAAAGQDVTATGDAAASTTQYKWSSSTAFDDNGDYLTATVDPPGTGDYTLECWVRFNSMSAGNQSILSFGNYSPAIYYRSSSSELAVYYSSAFYLSGFTPVADTWYHIAWTRSGTSCRLFVDGVQKGTTASNAHNVNNTNLRIGYDGVDYFGGYIEDVRYTKGLARYTADFTPPTAALEG